MGCWYRVDDKRARDRRQKAIALSSVQPAAPALQVDPVLRQKVWAHLTTLAHTHGQYLHTLKLNSVHLMDAELFFIYMYPGKTVIITTHYIEEARGADRVGFMRAGRYLLDCCSVQGLLL